MFVKATKEKPQVVICDNCARGIAVEVTIQLGPDGTEEHPILPEKWSYSSAVTLLCNLCNEAVAKALISRQKHNIGPYIK